nr:PREDICTED: centrobin [Latimeria chalumnae]|eukprot:XP_014345071.1 PREDICTED: centrobin [Latimeria chalumnae]
MAFLLHFFFFWSRFEYCSANPLIDISPPASSVASIEGLFPRYSRLRSTVTNASTAHTETRILKESLEKERTRRKHCEKQIQTLQNKILTLQQQLAVAVSADRKKDIMIEQLDKTLAKVVEGWKKHEAEKDEVTRRLQEERDVAEKTKAEQQEVMSNFEESLSQAVESMMKEQQLRSRLQEEMSRLEEENRKLLAQLESEKSRSRVLQAERDEAVQARLHKEKQLEAVRSTLEEQREIWAERERRLKQQILQLEEELQTKLEVEKIKLQKEVQRAEDCQQVLSSVQSDVQQLESELDTVRRERDNFQLEISLLQARLESQKSQLESEFKVSLELQLTERLAKLHEDSARQAATLREQHRLASNEEEIRNNQATRRRLEAQRAEMVKKFQALWQSHWNDALRLLMSDASQVARQNQMHHIKPNTASAEPQGISSGSVNYHMLPSIPLSSIAGSFQPFHISDTQQLHSVYRQQESPGNSRVRHAIHAEHEANSRQQPHASHRSADNPAAFNSSVSHNAVPQAIPLQPALQLSSPRPGAAVVSFGSSGGHSATGGDASHRSSAGHGQRQGAEEPRRTGSDQPSSHLSSLQSHSISATVPSPLGGRSRERQSPVLNQSAQSQQGFHDLQPQMDETSLSGVLTYRTITTNLSPSPAPSSLTVLPSKRP